MRLFKAVAEKLVGQAGYVVLNKTDSHVLRELLAIYRAFRLDCLNPVMRLDRSSYFSAMNSLQELINHYRINCVFDVGANKGQFGQALRSLDYQGRIVSFEPLPEARSELLGLAKNDKDWIIHPKAISAANGEVEFHVYADDTFSSVHSINESGARRFGDLVKEVEILRVETARLDDFIGDLPDNPRVLLKTDTQGNDLEVVRGASGLLPHVSVLVTEASFKPIYENGVAFDLIKELVEESGLRLSGIFPISHEEDSLELIEADCHFIKPRGGCRVF